MVQKLNKKQHVALKQIDDLQKERKRNIILAVASVVVMVILIVLYNYLAYTTGIIDMNNTIIRGALYAIAVVIAGFCGIMLMHASRKKAKIEAYRQSTGISRETFEAWKRGEIE